MNDVTHPNDYERSDADPRLIAALALGVAVFLIATPFVLLAVYPGRRSARRAAGRSAAAAGAAPAGRSPRPISIACTPTSATQLDHATAGSTASARSYAFPIERAMQLLGRARPCRLAVAPPAQPAPR